MEGIARRRLRDKAGESFEKNERLIASTALVTHLCINSFSPIICQ